MVLIVAAALAVAACKGQEGAKQPLGMAGGAGDPSGANPHPTISPEAKAALDSGNTLFRAHDYNGALAQYRAASKLAPTQAAPYYGVVMAAQKLNNKPLADSAMQMVQVLSGNASPMFSDSLMKKAHLDTSKVKPASKS